MAPKTALLVIAAIALASLLAPYAHAEEEPKIAIEGYVAEASGGKAPLEGVAVTIRGNSNGNETEFKSLTDADGRFSIAFAASITPTHIKFDISGYSLISCPNLRGTPGADDFIQLDLSNATYTEAGGVRTYAMTTGIDGWAPAVMSATFGFLRGTVTYDHGAVAGAQITAKLIDGSDSYVGSTDERGEFSIKVPTGTYTVTASMRGFLPGETYTVKVTSGTMSPLPISLTESGVSTYMGLDMAHILMAVGIILGAALVVSAWRMGRRTRNRLEVLEDDSDDV